MLLGKFPSDKLQKILGNISSYEVKIRGRIYVLSIAAAKISIKRLSIQGVQKSLDWRPGLISGVTKMLRNGVINILDILFLKGLSIGHKTLNSLRLFLLLKFAIYGKIAVTKGLIFESSKSQRNSQFSIEKTIISSIDSSFIDLMLIEIPCFTC